LKEKKTFGKTKTFLVSKGEINIYLFTNMKSRRFYPFEDPNVWRTLVLLFLALVLVGIVFFFFTNVFFQISVGAGIWFFYLVFFVFFVVLAVVFLGRTRLKPDYLWFKKFLYGVVFVFAVVLLVLGVVYRPFYHGNLEFKLGAVPIFDLDGTGAEPEEDVARDLAGVIPEVETTWESVLPAPVDQGAYCGSCWAVTGSTIMSARAVMKTDPSQFNTKEYVCPLPGTDVSRWMVSPQFVVDADGTNTQYGKCNSGAALDSFNIVRDTGGAPDMKCIPYTLGATPNCNCGSVEGISFGQRICGHGSSFVAKKCVDGTSFGNKVRVNSYYGVSGVEQMEKEITKNGPIMCQINYYRKKDGSRANWTLESRNSLWGQYSNYISRNYVSRPLYDGTEYTKRVESFSGTTNNDNGWHFVTVFGYGKVGDVEYWDCRNSWGPRWGTSGNVKIEKGVDAWNIESLCIGTRVSVF
jgi:hypothetical protein